MSPSQRIAPPVSVLVLVLSCQIAPAEEAPGDQVLREFLGREAARLEASFLPQIKSPAEFARKQAQLREDYYYMLGLWPLPERTPLGAVVTGTLERDDFVVEKLHFQSRPGLYVTCNLYRPRAAAGGRLPAVLYLCGHSGAGRNGNKVSFQDHGIWLAKHGYVCLLLDTLQLGEIAAIHHGTYREMRWWWHSAGYTPAGVECWNGMRALDYLESRDDVDPKRMGVTGISGGGASTFWVAAADNRARVAIPVSGMADLASYVGNRVIDGHCDCMFLYNTYRWNWTTIAALVCPRPLLFMNSDQDSIFPMDANERVIARLEHLYGVHGAGDAVDAVVSIGGHDYRRDLKQAAFRFLNTHLKGDAGPVADTEVGEPTGEPRAPVIPREALRVFPTDADLPADQLNTRIDEVFVPRARVSLPESGGFEKWRAELIGALSRSCFRAWPEMDLPGGIGSDASTGRRFLETEPGIRASWRERAGEAAGDPPWLLVLGPDDSEDDLPAWAAPLLGSQRVFLLSPRGVGPTRWTRKNPPNTVERSFALLGATADGGRVHDVLQVARALKRELGLPSLRAIGRGNAGIIGAYAALYEPGIAAVVLVDPPASHAPAPGGTAYGPAILNVLRVLDIPDALGLLAPRRLTVHGGNPEAFQRTAQIYERAGARGAFEKR